MARVWWSVLVGFLAWFGPSRAAAQQRPYDWGWGMHPMLMLMILVFWGVVIAGIVVAIRWLATQGKERHATETPLDLLRQRYARGDISRQSSRRGRETLPERSGRRRRP